MSIKLTSNSKFKNDHCILQWNNWLSRTLNYLAYNNIIVSIEHKYPFITVSLSQQH